MFITDGLLTELWITALAAIVNRTIPCVHADVAAAIATTSYRARTLA